MNIPTKFKEYIWLLSTIRKAKKISLAEINEESGRRIKRNPPTSKWTSGESLFKSGGYLLSHGCAVPSAQAGFARPLVASLCEELLCSGWEEDAAKRQLIIDGEAAGRSARLVQGAEQSEAPRQKTVSARVEEPQTL